MPTCYRITTIQLLVISCAEYSIKRKILSICCFILTSAGSYFTLPLLTDAVADCNEVTEKRVVYLTVLFG